MSSEARLLPKVELVPAGALTAELPSRPLPRASEVVRFPAIHRDRERQRLQARARRQALALMAASSLIMILVLYGAWTVCHGLIASLG